MSNKIYQCCAATKNNAQCKNTTSATLCDVHYDSPVAYERKLIQICNAKNKDSSNCKNKATRGLTCATHAPGAARRGPSESTKGKRNPYVIFCQEIYKPIYTAEKRPFDQAELSQLWQEAKDNNTEDYQHCVANSDFKK
jgi:hypothetical protein